MARQDQRDWRGGQGSGDESAHEEQVRQALRRVEAPEGFTDRLMVRAELLREQQPVAREKAGAAHAMWVRLTRPAWKLAYAAALLAVTASSLHIERVHREQRRVDQAAAQFDTALQVTQHALNHVSAKLEKTEFGKVEQALQTDRGGQ